MEYLNINTRTMKLEIDIMALPTSYVIDICDCKGGLREFQTHGEYKICEALRESEEDSD
ncbi:hypothetical protein [Psychrobacillus sp. FSL K6-1415]|uniref:hypothetical protein n=1 Tax=Psychrobacillus sp. FSL K6-1415 TaxID=2921544 RepID=UPI0030F56AFB